MPSSRRKPKYRRANRRFRRIFVEQLEDRSLLAATITVNSVLVTNARDSVLTLPEAMMISNRTLALTSLTADELAQVNGTPTSGDTDTIAFSIPGSGVQTITYSSPLPTITEAVIIDGYTQPGASPNTNGPLLGDNAVLLVELNALNGGGLFLDGVSGATIRGLAIHVYAGTNINIRSGSNNTIEGNFIGTDATGKTTHLTTDYGVKIFAGLSSANNNIIGGTTPAARNLISGNADEGISLTGNNNQNAFVQNTIIQGNFIGTDPAGTLSVGNGIGISIYPGATTTVIGGSSATGGNLISGNSSEGIAIGGTQTCNGGGINNANATGTVVQGNRIGTDVTGISALGNGTNGITVALDSTSRQVIGGVNAGEGNIIAFNTLHGIGVLASHAAIESNSIYSNGQLGIHLGNYCSPTPNDVDDADTGPNNLQNFPVISAPTLTASRLSLNYNVSSTTANSAYPLRVEFFKADAAGQEGKTFLGSDTYDATAAGTTKTVSFTSAAPIAVGDTIIATATDSAGNTSEFSASVTLQAGTCSSVVVNTNDSGAGSLRTAINCANSTPGTDTISFNIPGDGVHTISPKTDLPQITDKLVIDAYSQPGSSLNTLTGGDNAQLLIELEGSHESSGLGFGLYFGGASGSIVRGLVIDSFISGIEFDSNKATTGVTIAGNFIGTDPTGSIARPNNFGIRLNRLGTANIIGGTDPAARNVLSGNVYDGVIVFSNGNTIQGNLFGTDRTGTVALRNNSHDVHLGSDVDVAANNQVGGTTAGAGNVLAAAGDAGIAFYGSSGNVVQGNLIGTDVTGTRSLGKGNFGIRFEAGSGGNTIGGAAAGAGNVVAGANGPGISLVDATGNLIAGNFIGTDLSATVDLGNGGPSNAGGIFVSSTGNTIGGTDGGAGNTIAFNRGPGVIVSGSTGAVSAAILGNHIFSNTKGLGIDLSGDGVTPNDLEDADNGPNKLQNFPEISSATAVVGQLAVTYAVPSDPSNSQYPLRIEFFKADDGGTQGQTFVGSDTYTAAQAGVESSVTFTPAIAVAAGDKIVATATDAAGNTSEFSAAFIVQSCTTVTNTDDSGVGSLRQAIICADATPGLDTITFNIPGSDVQTISPLAALPTITDPVIIDGYTQPGASPNTNAIDDPDPLQRGLNGTLLIQLSGPAAGTPAMAGLTIAGNNSTVRGLVINGFANSGVMISGGNNNVIAGNYIGTDPTGESAAGNGKWGVLVNAGSAGNRIGTNGDGLEDAAEENLIGASGFGGIGIVGAGSDNNIVAGNLIGIDALGTGAIGNGNRGVDIFGGAQHNRIGTNADGLHDTAERNIISQNGWAGIGIYDAGTSFNVVAGNWIGIDITGSASGANAKGGMDIFGGATQNTIGGLAPGAGNVIAFNSQKGISLTDAATTSNAILGNSIFGNFGLGIDLGPTGFTPNDPEDADAGPNNLQNFPVITYATRDAGNLKVTYTVPSDPANSTYPIRIEFFLADANGQGQTYLGFDTFTEADFTADGNTPGEKTVTLPTAAPINVFDKIVATATDSLTAAVGGGPANTSEFSAEATIVSPWQNPGPLRWDVTDDTHVVADDVLTIINYINAHGSGRVPDSAANTQPFLDVDGDDSVVAADVIDVINYINAGKRLGGEAEAADKAADSQDQGAGDLMALLAADVASEAARKRK
ncbi:MAG TPA: hypothetical protein VGI40_15610 [Pirellulaceae bacterium]